LKSGHGGITRALDTCEQNITRRGHDYCRGSSPRVRTEQVSYVLPVDSNLEPEKMRRWHARMGRVGYEAPNEQHDPTSGS
jgi:hypothetical protein